MVVVAEGFVTYLPARAVRQGDTCWLNNGKLYDVVETVFFAVGQVRFVAARHGVKAPKNYRGRPPRTGVTLDLDEKIPVLVPMEPLNL